MRTLLLILIFACTTQMVHAESMRVRHGIVEAPEDSRQSYILNLLKLAMDKTIDTYGSYELEPVPLLWSSDRAIASVKNNELIDITLSITTKELEEELLPVRIPLFKGLIGYRVFIIKPENQYKFDGINTLEELRQYQAGQASGWPDTRILRENDIRVVTAFEYSSLFEMLRYDRFDYFPRSIMEVYKEVSMRDDLEIETRLALYYPAAFYFFVNKDNTMLAERLTLGLERAINDGSFDTLLNKDKGSHWAINQLKTYDRVVIPLLNSSLPKATPVNNTRYWYFTIKQ